MGGGGLHPQDIKYKMPSVKAVTLHVLVEFPMYTLSILETDVIRVHYVNVSGLIKFSQKTSVFTLIIHKFSIKSYVLDVY